MWQCNSAKAEQSWRGNLVLNHRQEDTQKAEGRQIIQRQTCDSMVKGASPLLWGKSLFSKGARWVGLPHGGWVMGEEVLVLSSLHTQDPLEIDCTSKYKG